MNRQGTLKYKDSHLQTQIYLYMYTHHIQYKTNTHLMDLKNVYQEKYNVHIHI